jgi:DnaJ-class molecular chaperone
MLDAFAARVRCHACDGTGTAIYVARSPSRYVVVICERCGGTGVR